MMKLFLFFIVAPILCLTSQNCLAQSCLEFSSEDLQFTLYGDTWKVRGNYVFSNYSTEDITQQIYFPIPADSTISAAQDLMISIKKPLEGQKCKMLAVKPEGFWFELSLPAQTITTCQIAYRQRLRGKLAKYILLTANSWGKPLEKAKYTLYVSNKLRIKKPPLPNPIIKQGWFHIKYTWEFTNYIPTCDFIVENRDFFY